MLKGREGRVSLLDRVGARRERDGKSVDNVGVRGGNLDKSRYTDRLYGLCRSRSGERHNSRDEMGEEDEVEGTVSQPFSKCRFDSMRNCRRPIFDSEDDN